MASSSPPTAERSQGRRGRHGKKYAGKAALITKSRYSIAEAAELLPQLGTANFDATAEVHIRINADTTQADQLVRTTVVLPHGTGRDIRIGAFVPDDRIEEARNAGASVAGNEDLIKQIEGGTIPFDVAVAVPEMMKNLGKVAKILGQKGLMPSPKAGTVSQNITKTIAELKQGRIECKMDKQGIIHTIFGKLSFGPDKLRENLEAVLQAVKDAQPSGIKGTYICSVSVSPSMGPGLKLEL